MSDWNVHEDLTLDKYDCSRDVFKLIQSIYLTEYEIR